jgi:hypothetical protein
MTKKLKRMLSSNEIGSNLERKVKEALGGSFVKQSGGGKFEKLDVRDAAKFIYSAKSTTKISDAGFRAIWKLWTEARRGARGPAGHGNGAKPAMVFEMNGELLVLTRLADHVAMATEEISPYIPANSKAQERRARALRNPRDHGVGSK